MSTLFVNQSSLEFPQSLTDKYRPKAIADFIGLDKPKRAMLKLAANPFSSAWGFMGPSGTGKTTLAMALAAAIPAELHQIPSQDCNLARISQVRSTCQYVPMSGHKMHLVLIDEADQMTPAAQVAMLSILDATNFPPATIFVLTMNSTERLEPRFISRLHMLEFSSYGIAKDATALLESIWASESSPNGSPAPNFARIVKDSNNNVRESLTRLETELLLQ